MKNSLDLNQLSQALSKAFAPILKHHVVIAFMIVLGFLIFTVFSVNSILSQTADLEYEATQRRENALTRFDNKTIEQINQLKSRQDNASLDLPSGRRNPFVE